MENVDEFFQGSYYNIIRVLLSVSGLWPYHTISRRCAIHLVLLLVLGSGLTFEVLGIVDVWPDSLEVVDCLPLLALGAVSLVKLVCAIYTLPEIRTLLIKMHEYRYSPKSDVETNILHSYALYGRNLGYAYTDVIFTPLRCVLILNHEGRKHWMLLCELGVLLSHTVVFVLSTLLTKFFDAKSDDPSNAAQTGFPYRVNYMVDPATYYVPIFIHTAVCDVLYTVLMITFDVLYLTLVQHCCGLFAALRYRLEYSLESESGNDGLTLIPTRDKLRSNIVYSIRRHAEAIQFVTIMESVYRLPLLVHVGANISVLSILGFQVIKSTQDVNRALKHVSYLSALLLNTFFENWQGQKIIDSSEKVYESAYNAEWYKMPTTQRKFLTMIMIRSKRSLKITAGNFVVLSYVNFSAVIRASSSYFMLLRSI